MTCQCELDHRHKIAGTTVFGDYCSSAGLEIASLFDLVARTSETRNRQPSVDGSLQDFERRLARTKIEVEEYQLGIYGLHVLPGALRGLAKGQGSRVPGTLEKSDHKPSNEDVVIDHSYLGALAGPFNERIPSPM